MRNKYIENIISFFSPSTGYKRMQSQTAMHVLEQHTRKYDGAAFGRRGKEWVGAGAGSANAELYGVAPTLRNRSRDLCRNNSYAKKAINNIANNTVGTGIQPGIKMLNRSQRRGQKEIESLKTLWRGWADSTDCDTEGLKTFWAIQHMVMKAVAESGECFVILRPSANGQNVPLKLQVIEADYLDESREYTDIQGATVSQGIVINSDGSRKGYYFWDQHPGETRTNRGIQSNFVDAANVIHIFLQERPGQRRGAPFLAPVMQRLKDFDEYEDAQLLRQKIAACFVAFISDSSDPLPGQSNEGSADLERVEPGIIEHLSPGKQVTFGNPPETQNYKEYTTSVLHGIAAGVGISYEALTGDFSQVNFSSGRMGWIEYQRQIDAWIWNMIVPILCQRVWSFFMKAARVKLGNPNLTASVTWTAPRRAMIDPEKETVAMMQRVNGMMSSWDDIAREMGEDADELFMRILDDKKRFEAAGLDIPQSIRLNAQPLSTNDSKKQ